MIGYLKFSPILFSYQVVAGGGGVLSWDCKQNISWTHAQGTVVWKDVVWVEIEGLLCPNSICSDMEKLQTCLRQGQNKGQYPSLFWHQLFSTPSPSLTVVPCQQLLFPGSCLNPAFGVCVVARPTWIMWEECVNEGIYVCVCVCV